MKREGEDIEVLSSLSGFFGKINTIRSFAQTTTYFLQCLFQTYSKEAKFKTRTRWRKQRRSSENEKQQTEDESVAQLPKQRTQD